MIKLCLNVNDVIPANEHTYYTKFDLYINFSDFWLMPLCFMTKKDNFKQKLLLWLQDPFKIQERSKPMVLQRFLLSCHRMRTEL